MKRLILSIAALLLGSGCTLLPGYQSGSSSLTNPQSVNTVVMDLMFVMNQLIEPDSTTVQYKDTDSVMSARILASVRSSGYALQKVTQDQGANFLNFEESIESASNGRKQYTFSIMIGDVSVERSYINMGRRAVYPSSPVIVRGTKKPAALDPDIFQLRQQDLASLYYVDYRDISDTAIRIPKVTLITEQLVSDIASGSAQLPNEIGLNASNLETYNVFFTNESNFTEVTRGYRLMRRDIIAFGDDSLRLGAVGKQKIKRIFASYNKDSDVISLLGCSNGSTASPLGNEGLALGRAKRVLEEFQSLGVARSALLDEGCWAPDALNGRYPGRGVVVELKRRTS